MKGNAIKASEVFKSLLEEVKKNMKREEQRRKKRDKKEKKDNDTNTRTNKTDTTRGGDTRDNTKVQVHVHPLLTVLQSSGSATLTAQMLQYDTAIRELKEEVEFLKKKLSSQEETFALRLQTELQNFRDEFFSKMQEVLRQSQNTPQ